MESADYVSPFTTPVFSLSLPDGGNFLSIAFFIVFVLWVFYTLVVSYHWFRYSHRSWLAVPAIGLHVFVSGLIIIYMASGLI